MTTTAMILAVELITIEIYNAKYALIIKNQNFYDFEKMFYVYKETKKDVFYCKKMDISSIQNVLDQ